MEDVRFDPAQRDVVARLKAPPQPIHQYHFEFQKFHITNTRAFHNDTDTVSVALKDGGRPARVLIKHLGDVNNGDHLVQLKIGPITFPANEQVSLVTTVINSGHKDDASLDDDLTTAANQAIDLALDEIPGGVLIEFVTHWLVNLFAVDCDGVVIGQRWTWSVNELKAHTDTHNPWIIQHAYHGTDSAVGCGGNSDYTGTWIITRTDQST